MVYFPVFLYSVCTFSLFNAISLTPSDLSPHQVLSQSEALTLGSRISNAITGMDNVDHADMPWKNGEGAETQRIKSKRRE